MNKNDQIDRRNHLGNLWDYKKELFALENVLGDQFDKEILV